MNKPRADWKTPVRRPELTTEQAHLMPLFDLRYLLSADLLYSHQRGDDMRALWCAVEIRFMGKSVSNEPSITADLISNGVSDMASIRLMQIAGDLKIGGAGGAAPEQVNSLINSLLNRTSEDAAVL